VLLGSLGGRHAPGEGRSIGLDGLGVGSEGCVGCCARDRRREVERICAVWVGSYGGWALDGDWDQSVVLVKVCVRSLLLLICFCLLRSVRLFGGTVGHYLRADDHSGSICGPREGECFAADVELAHAGLGAHIPEADCAVCRAAG
jgi:hypothetical protein